MKQIEYQKDIVDFAYDIIDMEKKIQRLEAENEALKEANENYIKQLNEHADHTKGMISMIFTETLKSVEQ